MSKLTKEHVRWVRATPPELMTPAEAAAWLGVSPRHLRRIDAKHGLSHEVAGKPKFERVRLRAFVRKERKRAQAREGYERRKDEAAPTRTE